MDALKDTDMTGRVYELPARADLPASMSYHDDGSDVGGRAPSGHTTIYPTQGTTLGEFQNANKNLDWRYIGRINPNKDGTTEFRPAKDR